MVGFGSIKPNAGNNRNTRIEEKIDLMKLTNKWSTVRFVHSRVLPTATHWFDIIGSKSKEKVSISKMCVGFDMEKESHNSDDCPYCKLGLTYSISYYANCIDRAAQEKKPRKIPKPTKQELKTGFKDINSESWTPVRVLRIPSSLAKKIQSLKDLNIRKSKTGEKKSYFVDDVKYGADVNIKYDAKAAGTEKYQIQLAEKSALTEEEQAYLIWDLSSELFNVETYEQAQREIKRTEILDSDGKRINDDLDDAEESVGSKKSKKQKYELPEDDDDDDSELDTDDDEDLDDEDEPKSKKSKSKKKPVEDDDEDLDDDDDDEPKSKKSNSKKKPVEDDEDDEDFDDDEDPPFDTDDDEDLDDDEDEPPAKSKKSKSNVKAKKKPVVEDDDDEDFDDLDDDEDDEPPAKSKKKKPVDDDDDEDFDDLDDDEDEPPAKSKKSKSNVKAKKKPVVEDDDDEDLNDLDEDDDEPPVKSKKKK